MDAPPPTPPSVQRMLRLRSWFLALVLPLGFAYVGIYLALYGTEGDLGVYRFFVAGREVFQLLSYAAVGLGVLLGAATFAAAKQHGGGLYAGGHLLLLVLGSFLFLAGPVLVPLIVSQEITDGTAAYRKRTLTLRPLDWVVLGLALIAGVLALR